MDWMDLEFDAEAIASGIAKWVAVESPSYDATAVNRMMDLASEHMAALGAEITRFPGAEGFGDVVKAHFPWGKGPGLMILGHLDTVHLVGTLAESLPLRREGDLLYGPGAQDMKGGMFLAVHVLGEIIARRGPLPVPVTVLFIPDEELGSPSSREVIEREAQACKAVLVPEPGKGDKLVTGRHAFLRYRIRVTGKPAHAGVASGVGRSAISAMARLVAEIEAMSDVEREVTYRVGNIRGGTFVNVIPTLCEAEALCVAPTQDAVALIQDRMAGLASPDPEVALEVIPGPVRPLFQASEGNLELYEVGARVAKELGLDLGHGQFGGGSDGNFTGALGIPTLDGLGVVGAGLHTKEEHISVSQLTTRARLFAGVLCELSVRNR